MPTYEYACDACGHEFEREQRITEDAIKTCPKCGKEKARRMITQGNFILKGGGWYSDLYSSTGGKKSGGGSETASSSEKSTTSESAGDGAAKPPKAESKTAE